MRQSLPLPSTACITSAEKATFWVRFTVKLLWQLKFTFHLFLLLRIWIHTPIPHFKQTTFIDIILFDYCSCTRCDTLFSSFMLLEHHKEEFEHWSDDDDDDDIRASCCRRRDDFTDTDSFTSDAESEDLERLL